MLVFFYNTTFVGIKHENYLNDKNDVIALEGKWEKKKNLIFDLKKDFQRNRIKCKKFDLKRNVP